MTNIQKVALILNVTGLAGLLVSRYRNSSNDVLGIDSKTVDKLFLASAVLGGVVLTITSFQQMKKV